MLFMLDVFFDHKELQNQRLKSFMSEQKEKIGSIFQYVKSHMRDIDPNIEPTLRKSLSDRLTKLRDSSEAQVASLIEVQAASPIETQIDSSELHTVSQNSHDERLEETLRKIAKIEESRKDI